MAERSRLLVTGGAGYVGSHAVWALHDRGDEVVVFDSLRQGHPEALPPSVRLVQGELADEAALDAVLADGRWDGVLHFAALSLVGESMQRPFYYLQENAGLGVRLIDACVRHNVPRFILSSTAALFGNPETMPITEDTRIDPGSPYGESKLMIERALHWADRIHGLRYACLRYFNAAGADPDGRSGEDHNPETHLIPLVIDAALGLRPEIRVFGDDYPTPDGTCIRDYVHVLDLADAHLLALPAPAPGEHRVYNLGNGTGFSVQQVVDAVREVTGHPVPVVVGARRAGDPAQLVASSDRIRADLGWAPQHAELATMVRDAWELSRPVGR
jgi:UDP-glucose 4-epimerase